MKNLLLIFLAVSLSSQASWSWPGRKKPSQTPTVAKGGTSQEDDALDKSISKEEAQRLRSFKADANCFVKGVASNVIERYTYEVSDDQQISIKVTSVGPINPFGLSPGVTLPMLLVVRPSQSILGQEVTVNCSRSGMTAYGRLLGIIK